MADRISIRMRPVLLVRETDNPNASISDWAYGEVVRLPSFYRSDSPLAATSDESTKEGTTTVSQGTTLYRLLVLSTVVNLTQGAWGDNAAQG